MIQEVAGVAMQSSLAQADFGIMFVSLAEQMTALGERRPITYSIKKINKRPGSDQAKLAHSHS